MPKILIIEDEHPIREALQMFFEDHGFSTLTAQDGLTGLALFQKEQPPIVLLDLSLPGKKGQDVLKEMRKLAPQTIVIISTGYSEEDIMSIITTDGVQGVLKKPFRLRDVQKQILPIIHQFFPPSTE